MQTELKTVIDNALEPFLGKPLNDSTKSDISMAINQIMKDHWKDRFEILNYISLKIKVKP